MATIQVRDVFADPYETIRRPAPSSGRSVQSYLRDVVIAFAARPTTEAVLEIMESERDSRRCIAMLRT